MSDKSVGAGIYDTTIRMFFLLLIIAWCLAILYPFISIMLWGLILAMAFKPMHDSLVKLMGGKAKLSAFIIVLVSLAVIIAPGWFFTDVLFENIKAIKTDYAKGTLTIPPPAEKVRSWPVIGDQLFDAWNSASVNLEGFIVKHKDQLTHKTIGNVVKGILGVALIQALLIGIGIFIAKVPLAGVLTLLVFVLAILQIPAIIVVLPVIVYLFADREPLPAILWTIFLFLAGLSDNILKPLLLGKGAPVPMLVIFIGVIGGFIFSGFIGLFTGAIIMSIGYKLFVAWINTAPDER
jgi:predicted PurR-regulated permease PerM